MITTGAKWFYGFGIVAFVLAVLYGWATGGDALGPLSAGYKGGVGDHLGYAVLLGASAVAVFLGAVSTALRDADPHAIAGVAGTEAPPPVTPAGHSYWPAVAAVGAGATVAGLVVEPLLFVLGLIVLGVSLVEWMVQAWADRATGDPRANQEIRNRLMHPVEVPLGGALAIAVVVLSISRVFLAVSSNGAVWVATGLAALVLLVGALIASRPAMRTDLVAALVALGAVGVIAAGVVSAAVGERDFERHGTEGEHEPAPGAETGEPSGGDPAQSTTTSALTSTTEAHG